MLAAVGGASGVLDRRDECGVNCEESLNMMKNKEGMLFMWSEN